MRWHQIDRLVLMIVSLADSNVDWGPSPALYFDIVQCIVNSRDRSLMVILPSSWPANACCLGCARRLWNSLKTEDYSGRRDWQLLHYGRRRVIGMFGGLRFAWGIRISVKFNRRISSRDAEQLAKFQYEIGIKTHTLLVSRPHHRIDGLMQERCNSIANITRLMSLNTETAPWW